MTTTLRYGFELDRDYFMDFAFRLYSILPIISSLTIYPANLYLLTVGIPGMKFEVRAAYILNLIAHITFDWTFTFFVRVYQFPPYGLFYCEGLFSALGLNKRIIMGVLAWATTLAITVFFILMVQLHQLTVYDSKSRWKLSRPVQVVIYAMLSAFCSINVAFFVIYGEDVENYEELIQNPDLAWLVERGGTLLLFGEPGVSSAFRRELHFLLISVVIFAPFFILYVTHAITYLLKRDQHSKSSKTRLLTRRLFDTFSTQLIGATFFFIIPLIFVLVTSVHGIAIGQILPGSVFAALRFITTMLLIVDAAQFSIVFFVRSSIHRKIVVRRLRKIGIFNRILNFVNIGSDNIKSVVTVNGRSVD